MRLWGYCRWSAELNLSARSNMKNKKRTRVGSEVQYDPRTAGEILHDYLENSNEPLARAYREHTSEADLQGWHPNTDLGCDVKTILRSDRTMKTGKEYLGVMRRDSDAVVEDYLFRNTHYTFVETLPWTMKRNPRVFVGKHITVTRRDDGTLRLNFKPLKIDKDFSIDGYAIGVCNELRQALEGLVENR